jgi:translation initiation factor RLI1
MSRSASCSSESSLLLSRRAMSGSARPRWLARATTRQAPERARWRVATLPLGWCRIRLDGGRIQGDEVLASLGEPPMGRTVAVDAMAAGQIKHHQIIAAQGLESEAKRRIQRL